MSTSRSAHPDIRICQIERVFPDHSGPRNRIPPRTIPLSLLDATTSNFGLTSAIWLFAPTKVTPKGQNTAQGDSTFAINLHKSLRTALSTYPQWCGQVKVITTLDEAQMPPEVKHFPPHARRFGRLYARFNTPEDPGVELITATSSSTPEDLYPRSRTRKSPIWNDQTCHSPSAFLPPTHVATMLAPHNFTENDPPRPVLAIQLTELSGGSTGGFVLAAKAVHPLADISVLGQFINQWAAICRTAVSRPQIPRNPLDIFTAPIFNPSLLDDQAAGDINASNADPLIVEKAHNIGFHRFDWWMPGADYPQNWSSHVPTAFKEQHERGDLKPAGPPMPWSEWDTTAPVSGAVIHLTRDQVDYLWQIASNTTTPEIPGHQGGGPGPEPDAPPTSPNPIKVSKHDAILSHIWSSINRARNPHHHHHHHQQQPSTPPSESTIHCNLTLNVRRPLNLPPSFQGSPILMLNIPTTASQILQPQSISLPQTSRLIRSRINQLTRIDDKDATIPAHLHALSYESSPQRLWQGFLGRNHILVTTWANAGLYDVDFGFGHGVPAYVDGDLPRSDGLIYIKEGPPPPLLVEEGFVGGRGGGGGGGGGGGEEDRTGSWTDNGVDVSVWLKVEDMERLLRDPGLLPVVERN